MAPVTTGSGARQTISGQVNHFSKMRGLAKGVASEIATMPTAVKTQRGAQEAHGLSLQFALGLVDQPGRAHRRIGGGEAQRDERAEAERRRAALEPQHVDAEHVALRQRGGQRAGEEQRSSSATCGAPAPWRGNRRRRRAG